MLVVITIIGVLLTVGALGLKNLSQSRGVSAGVPLVEAAFSEARGVSQGNGGSTRVLIHADPEDRERYLRFMLVVSLTESGDWVATGRGTYLPENVYFSQEYSYLDHSGETGEIPSEEHNIFSSESSGSRNENLSGEYFYYQFNAEGNAADAGASFIVGSGSRTPGAENQRVTSTSGVSNFGGIIVWKKGTTSVFRHPEQMNIPDEISNGDEF